MKPELEIQSTNPKLEAIAHDAGKNLKHLISENTVEILAAWAKCEEEGLLNETSPKLRLGFAIIMDLDADKVTHRLSWSVTTVREIEGQIPDPNQLELPMADETQ